MRFKAGKMNGFAKIILNIRITVLFLLFIIMFCGNALGISADNLFSKEMKERTATYDVRVNIQGLCFCSIHNPQEILLFPNKNHLLADDFSSPCALKDAL